MTSSRSSAARPRTSREMIGLGLPVPPGFVVTTETCRAFLAGGWPDGLDDELRTRMAEVEAAVGRRLRRRRGSLARQRPVGGAGVDARDDGHDPRPRAERRDRGRAGTRVRQRGVRPELSRAVRGQLPVDRRRRRRPRRSVAPAAARDRGRLPLVEQRPRPGVSREGGDRRRPRDRGHGPGDGLRQPRRDIGDRRRCSRATRRPASRPSTATSCSTPRARTSSPGPTRPSRSPSLDERLPAVAAELREHASRLEHHYADLCDIEFTIEDGRLWMLQVRVGKRSPQAALRIAVDMAEDATFPLTRAEAVGTGRAAAGRSADGTTSGRTASSRRW